MYTKAHCTIDGQTIQYTEQAAYINGVQVYSGIVTLARLTMLVSIYKKSSK